MASDRIASAWAGRISSSYARTIVPIVRTTLKIKKNFFITASISVVCLLLEQTYITLYPGLSWKCQGEVKTMWTSSSLRFFMHICHQNAFHNAFPQWHIDVILWNLTLGLTLLHWIPPRGKSWRFVCTKPSGVERNRGPERLIRPRGDLASESRGEEHASIASKSSATKVSIIKELRLNVDLLEWCQRNHCCPR